MSSICRIVMLSLFILVNTFAVFFIDVPALRKNNNTLTWVTLGMNIGAISTCSLALGVLLS